MYIGMDIRWELSADLENKIKGKIRNGNTLIYSLFTDHISAIHVLKNQLNAIAHTTFMSSQLALHMMAHLISCPKYRSLEVSLAQWHILHLKTRMFSHHLGKSHKSTD